MAYSVNLIDYTEVTTGASADVGVQPSDNCHTIIMFNRDSTDAALVGIVTIGVNLTTANSAYLPAGGALTLRIGTVAYRPCGSIGPASQGNVVLRTEAVAGTPIIGFQYINSSQPVAP
jgi:hypothetical protein